MQFFAVNVLLCLAVLVATVSAEKEESKDDKKFSDVVKDVTETVGSPEMKAAMELLKATKTETSTTISDERHRAGFLSLDNRLNYKMGSIRVTKIDDLLKIWMRDSTFASLDQVYKDVFALSMEEYYLQCELAQKFKSTEYHLSFNDNAGKITMLTVIFDPHPTMEGVLNYEKFVSTMNFKPAPNYVVITSSDCGMLHCDTDQQIVYLPSTITDQHVKSLLYSNFEFLNSFTSMRAINVA